MRKLLIPLLGLLPMTGCLKEQPSVPPVPGQQTVFMQGNDTEVCRTLTNAFEHYELHAPIPSDSVKWSMNIGGGDWTSLGTDTVLLLPVEQGTGSIRCLVHLNGVSQLKHVSFYNCYRMILVPTAFTPDGDGINDGWFPVVNSTGPDDIESLHWQVRSLDGTLLYESPDAYGHWDGQYKGQRVLGNLLYHIRVKFAGEEEIVFTGMFISLG